MVSVDDKRVEASWFVVQGEEIFLMENDDITSESNEWDLVSAASSVWTTDGVLDNKETTFRDAVFGDIVGTAPSVPDSSSKLPPTTSFASTEQSAKLSKPLAGRAIWLKRKEQADAKKCKEERKLARRKRKAMKRDEKRRRKEQEAETLKQKTIKDLFASDSEEEASK